MKLTINFSNEEKNTLKGMMILSGAALKDENNSSEHYKGSFGEYIYDNTNNVIEFNLKEGFVKAFAGLMGSYINLIKSFMCNCEMFASSWLLDIEKKEKTDEPQTSVTEE